MSGAIADSSDDPTTSQPAGTRSTKIPTLRLIHTPTKRLGRRYKDVVSMVWFCTSWKLETRQYYSCINLDGRAYYKLENVTSAVSAPRDNATSAQTLAKGTLFHSEFGTSAGFPLRSRYRIHKGNAMSITMLRARRLAVVAERITASSALIIL
jgi:hypothetical protein